jgi:hypothetical protein
LSELTKVRIRELYSSQYEQVMQCLDRAFSHNENNSLLILARSKQIIHSLISRVIQDEEGKRHQLEQTLKVVRVNTTLLDANESKILMKFCEVIGL